LAISAENPFRTVPDPHRGQLSASGVIRTNTDRRR
jgi:hypothetical protein